jgi:hypothetical protein
MKMISTAAALLLGAGVVWAQTPPSSQVPPSGQTPPSSGQTPPSTGQTPPGGSQSPTGDRDDMSKKHKMTAEVVSTDSSAKTITVKNLAMSGSSSGSAGSTSGSSSGTVTLRLEDKAQDRIASLKSGDKVTLTCKGGSKSGAGSDTPSNPPSAGAEGSSGMGASGCQTVTDISKSY